MHPAIPTRPAGAVARLLPPDVACLETAGDRTFVELFPAERLVAEAYSPPRQAEFATGRACAHEALVALGLPAEPILPGPAGDPTWPAGVVGSITHCIGYRAAAVALARSYDAIGIDAEPHLTLPARVLDAVAGPRELAALADLPADGTAWDRVLFSAKEAAYKAWFPLVRGAVLATGIAVRLHPDGDFDAVIDACALPGRWSVTRGLVHTAVSLPRRAPAYPAGRPPPYHGPAR